MRFRGVVEPDQWAKAHFFVGMKEAVASKIEEVAQRVAESEGLEIVEVEVKGGGAGHRLVRIAIDKPAGVTHAASGSSSVATEQRDASATPAPSPACCCC